VKVLVAGATGAIGRPLVPLLLAAGHEVTGLTRREDRAARLREAGAEAVICDALDPAAVRDAVLRARPDAIVDQLTSLPDEYDVRRKDLYDATDRIRREGTAALVAAAREAGVGRYVLQSIAFLYAPEGDWVKDEDARVWSDAPPPFGRAVDVLVTNERTIVSSPDLAGIALRYGFFYGPGTYYASDGSLAARVRKRQFPIVGRGGAMTSYVHLDDAASATVAALERGAPGVYHVVDDEPAPMRDWLPVYAGAIGARKPFRIPVWLARLVAGEFAVAGATGLRGASNARAKRELGWQPSLPTWREGFASALDRHPALERLGARPSGPRP
jgi:nucleoside-diphosphate-sugar epimerase